MPTDKPRITFALDEGMLKSIDNYKYKHRIKNQSQAIIALIEKGLDGFQIINPKNEKNSPASADAEEDRISVDEMKILLRRLGLICENDDITEKDAAFVSGIFDLLNAWFSR